MTENGYAKLHPVPLRVRADMLESVAGLDAAGLDRELSFAVGTLNLSDPGSCRWLVCLLARRVDECEGAGAVV